MDLVFPIVCPICDARVFDEVAIAAAGDCVIMPETLVVCPKCLQRQKDKYFKEQDALYHESMQYY